MIVCTHIFATNIPPFLLHFTEHPVSNFTNSLYIFLVLIWGVPFCNPQKSKSASHAVLHLSMRIASEYPVFLPLFLSLIPVQKYSVDLLLGWGDENFFNSVKFVKNISNLLSLLRYMRTNE